MPYSQAAGLTRKEGDLKGTLKLIAKKSLRHTHSFCEERPPKDLKQARRRYAFLGRQGDQIIYWRKQENSSLELNGLTFNVATERYYLKNWIAKQESKLAKLKEKARRKKR